MWTFLRQKWRQAAAWLGGQEPMVLLVLLAILGAAWLFLEIADEVLEGEPHAFDVWMVQAMREPEDPSVPIGPRWLREAGRDVTALGGTFWLVFATLAVSGYLWLDRKRRMAAFLLVSASSGWLVSTGLKAWFARPRPDVVPHLSETYTSSFPSGHSMLSAVVYLTLGALLAAAAPRRRVKIYILAIVVILSALVGVSRVYLGVHYPTDVVAGWAAGLIWALLCWLVAHWLQKRGDVEEPSEPEEETEAQGAAAKG